MRIDTEASALDELRADLVVCLMNGHSFTLAGAEQRVEEIASAVRHEHGERIAKAIDARKRVAAKAVVYEAYDIAEKVARDLSPPP